MKKKTALRFNKSKPRLHLIPEEALFAMAAGFMAGEDKGYPKFNYRKGLSWLETTDSLRRHLLAFLMGEDLDPETKIPHVQLILTNAAMLEYNRIHHKHLDDRFTPDKYKNTKGKVNVKVQKATPGSKTAKKKPPMGRRR